MDSASSPTEIVVPESKVSSPPRSSCDTENQPPEHRISCHRCGNIRKRRHLCTRKSCPHIFCGRCCDKMRDEYGSEIFVDGCPVCKDLCCCSNKSISCNRVNHCYRKCPASKNKTACAAYKEEMSQNQSDNAAALAANEKASGILDLLAAVADKQLTDVSGGKRKISATEQPLPTVTNFQSVAVTNDLSYSSLQLDGHPALKYQAIPLEGIPILYTAQGVPVSLVRYPMMGTDIAVVPIAHLSTSSHGGIQSIGFPYKVMSGADYFNFQGINASEMRSRTVDERGLNPAMKTEVSSYPSNFRPNPVADDGYLYDLNGIDGYVTPKPSAGPVANYPFLSKPSMPNLVSMAAPSTAATTTAVPSPPLTRRIPFAGTDFPPVRNTKSFDVVQKPSVPQNGQPNLVTLNDSASSNTDGTSIERKSSPLVYSGNGDPINILALVSSYSSAITNKKNTSTTKN